jgi:hypothetical protein
MTEEGGVSAPSRPRDPAGRGSGRDPPVRTLHVDHRGPGQTGPVSTWTGPRILGGWCLLLVLAVANGAFREAVLAPRLAAAAAQRWSCATGIVVLGAAMAFLIRRRPLASSSDAWRVGGLWAALTVLFEFTFGWARGAPAEALLAQYAVWDGNLWPLVLAWVLCAPRLFRALSGASARSPSAPP